MDAYGAYKRSEAETAARERLTREGVPAGELEARIKLSEEVRQAATDYAQGSLYWQAGTALTAALSGGLGGNLQGALSGAAAPYLAKLVKDVSSGNEPVRIALHTVLGAFLARTQGGSATGGALGGFTAAAASGLIAKALYPDVEQLSPEQKQLVANLVMIAGAGVGGLAGGNLTDAGSAANTAKNEVENNSLGCLPTRCINSPGDDLMRGGGMGGGMMGGAAGAGLGAIIAEIFGGNDKSAVTDTGGDQIANQGPTDTGGDQTATGNVPSHTGNGQPQGQGVTNTGNTDGAPSTAGNTTTTPIPDGPNKDDLAYLSEKPLGLGSTGRTQANSLQEKLAMDQALSNPAAGRQLPIPMTDKRWPKEEGWVKMAQNINGVEIHYVRNTKTNQVDDFKFK
ncbi:VENN motif pre-toxin domain-containing protein [Dickeya ananatis]|uniref:VENN motif pre-toxin domain-containing protein n=1 Tax=Dickeya ananatis TaxID=3061286 RepID=UPI00388FA007